MTSGLESELIAFNPRYIEWYIAHVMLLCKPSLSPPDGYRKEENRGLEPGGVASEENWLKNGFNVPKITRPTGFYIIFIIIRCY